MKEKSEKERRFLSQVRSRSKTSAMESEGGQGKAIWKERCLDIKVTG